MAQLLINIFKFKFWFFTKAGLFVFFFITSLSLVAQQNLKEKLSIGFEGGTQFTNINSTIYSNAPTSRIKPDIGIFALYDITQDFKIKFGFYYDTRAYRVRYKSGYLAETDTSSYVGYNSYFQYDLIYNVDFLTIPLNFVYEKEGDKFGIFLEVGFYYSFYLGNNVSGFTDFYVHPNDAPHFNDPNLTQGHHRVAFDGPVDNFFNTYDFGINLHFGIAYFINPQIELRFAPGFTYGLANVFENPNFQSRWSNLFKLRFGIVYKLHRSN